MQSHCRVMAEHLASIFGTEKDRVNCPFYFKIGACRHGDRCSRMHNRPTISPTLLFSNMYQRPDMAISGTDPHAQNMDPRKLQEHFEVTLFFLHNSCFFLITVMPTEVDKKVHHFFFLSFSMTARMVGILWICFAHCLL